MRHDLIIQKLSERLTDEELDFLKLILKENEVDVSYMTDEEYATCMDGVFNAIEYNAKHYEKTGEKMMHKSIGIGSETSQIIGLYYLAEVDNYIKIVRGFKYYARYMDDSYVIHSDKDVLRELLEELKVRYAALGLQINVKKTQIHSLRKPVIYLKTIYILTDTGKVVRRKCKDTFKRERVKLKKFAVKLENKELKYKMIETQYLSWRGTIRRRKGRMFKNYKQIMRMDKLYNELFILPFIRGGYARC